VDGARGGRGPLGAGAPPPAPAPPRFLADVMLERLARWLRAADVDTASAPPTAPDAAVRALAAAEGRVLLTRDRRLAEACAREGPARACHRVRADAPLAQLLEVAGAFGLGRPAPAPALTFARCLVCNTPLRPAPGDVLPAPAPPDRPLRECPNCGRVYWEGGHTRRMRAALAAAAAAPPGLDAPPEGGHAACSAPPPPDHPAQSTAEDLMSGSPGNTSAGTKGGRTPRDGNHDLTARHGDDLAHGVRHSDDTGASTSARPTESGEADTRRQDPDDPSSTHENQSEA
jgi:uncharacterized protein with PIN domain